MRSAEKSPSSEPRGATTFSCGARVTTQALPGGCAQRPDENAERDRRQQDQQRRAAAEPPAHSAGAAAAAAARRAGSSARVALSSAMLMAAEKVMPTLMWRRQSFTSSP